MGNDLPPLAFGLTQLPMLWWLGAAAAPLLIHLLSRRRYRETSWAAMEFLLAALQHSSRRLRAEQWLLLAIRTAIIVCLVIAVAGPYLEQIGGSAAVGQPVLKVLVVDGSYSMAYKPADESRFEQVRRLAMDIVARSTLGDGFALVLMSTPSKTVVAGPAYVSDEVRDALRKGVASTGPQSTADGRKSNDDPFVKAIEELPLTHGGADVASAIYQINDIIARAQKESPRLAGVEIYVLTDLGATSWDFSKAPSGKATRRQLTKLAEQSRLTVVDVGQDRCENIAVTSLTTPERILTTRAPVEVTARLRNFGSQPQRPKVELLVDGQRAEERALELGPQSEQSVTFSAQLETPGDHVVEAAVTGGVGDFLDVDNHRWLSLTVKPALHVLIVNGEGSREHTRYLASALDPYRDGSGTLPVHVEQTSDGRLAELDLRRFDCLMLSDVGQFTPAEAKLLTDYVQSGGGLIVFLGERADPQNYNAQLGGSGGGGPLLPAQLDKPSDAGQYTFDPLGYQDPIVHEFQGNERAGLLTTSITRYFRVKPLKPPAGQFGPQTALSIAQAHDPVIVSHVLSGKSPAELGGRVVLVALPVSFASIDPATKEPWSNWPIKTSFPPIVQNLLMAAVSSPSGQRNLLVGKPLEATLPPGQASSTVTLEDPLRRKEQIRVAARDEARHWSYANTWLSGPYRAEVSADQPPRLFAVNLDTQESDLSKADAKQLPEQVAVVSGWGQQDERAPTTLSSKLGVQLWLLNTAVALLLLELIVAWWFGYRASRAL